MLLEAKVMGAPIYDDGAKESSYISKLKQVYNKGKKGLDYLCETSVTEGAKDLGKFLKNDYIQTKKDISDVVSKTYDSTSGLMDKLGLTDKYKGAKEIKDMVSEGNYEGIRQIGCNTFGYDKFKDMMGNAYSHVKKSSGDAYKAFKSF